MAGCEIQNCASNNGVIAFIVLFYFYFVYFYLFWYLPHAHDQYHKECRSVLKYKDSTGIPLVEFCCMAIYLLCLLVVDLLFSLQSIKNHFFRI